MNLSISAFDCAIAEVERIAKLASQVSISAYRKGDADIEKVALKLLDAIEKVSTIHNEARRIALNIRKHERKKSVLPYIGPFCHLRAPKENVVLYSLDAVNEGLENVCLFLQPCIGEDVVDNTQLINSFQNTFNVFGERTNVFVDGLVAVYKKLQKEFPEVALKAERMCAESPLLPKFAIGSVKKKSGVQRSNTPVDDSSSSSSSTSSASSSSYPSMMQPNKHLPITSEAINRALQEREEADFQRVLEASMRDVHYRNASSSSTSSASSSSYSSNFSTAHATAVTSTQEEDEELARALALSMQPE